MAEGIVFEAEDKNEATKINEPKRALVSWILDKTDSWEEYRNSNYEEIWGEYYRLWRSIHHDSDKTRKSERSKLIHPALSQAIEVAVAEQEEAVFGRGRWFDIDDDVMDKDNSDVLGFRNILTEDLEEVNVRSALSEIFLNGALYGTGIGKIVVESVEDKVMERGDFSPQITTKDSIKVKLLPISPSEFVIDPLARNIQEALGMAHIMVVPKHTIVSKQRKGIYNDGYLGSFSDERSILGDVEAKYTKDDDKCRITEYHGLVPKSLLEAANTPIDEEVEELANLDVDQFIDVEDDELVEVIVTIANDSTLLKAVENPFMMGDRCFMAYQHDTIPNRFWGRGVAEKGYNPQKALDAELRGRIDAMALAIHPMVAVDATRIPRGETFSVRPGRTILTQGDPRTTIMPFNFGQVGTNTFPQSGELERMIQMGTGSMDSATSPAINPGNSTASGMSMIAGGAIKRSKRTMANIEKNLITPLIHKAAWRYMQFDSERYEQIDIKFIAYSALGIMAREVEQGNIANLLKTVPGDSPAYWMLLHSFYENSTIYEKESMLAIIDQMMEKSLNPQPDPMEQQHMQMQMQQIMKDIEKTDSEVLLNKAKIQEMLQQDMSGASDANKTQMEAQLKLAIQEMEGKVKKDVAEIQARTTVQIKAMDLASQKDTVIEELKLGAREGLTEGLIEEVKIMTSGKLEKLDKIEESISKLDEEMEEREKDRQAVNNKVIEYLSKRGGEVAKLAKEINKV